MWGGGGGGYFAPQVKDFHYYLFQLLSRKMEMEKDKTPMFIIANLKFDNVLIWPHKIKDKFQEFSQNECPSMSTGR